jgi:hypothetical protein
MYHKLHLLVYLLEYMKMHGPGNIKFVILFLCFIYFALVLNVAYHNAVKMLCRCPFVTFWGLLKVLLLFLVLIPTCWWFGKTMHSINTGSEEVNIFIQNFYTIWFSVNLVSKVLSFSSNLMLPSDISITQRLGTRELAMQTFSSERLLCPARHRSCTCTSLL